MELIRKISEEISQIDIRLEPKPYSREVLKIICANLGYHFGSIILLDEKGLGTLFSAYNLPEDYPKLVARAHVPVLSSPSGEAVTQGKTLVVNRIAQAPRLKPWYDLLNRFNIKTIVWTPLFNKGKAFGTYNLYDHRQREVSEKEISLLNQLSILFSLAIQSNEYIDEIRQKNEELRIAKEQAEAANRAKTQFLANISHEFRTPMNAIMGFTNLLLEEGQTPEKYELLKMVHESGEILMKLINEVLDLAKIEAGKLELEKSYFAINDLMNEIYRMFTDKAKESNLVFEVLTDSAVPAMVFGDRTRVSEVIFNVLRNAFKFTRRGRITVNCSYKEGTAYIEIADTGIGIPRDKLEMIFSAFTQADSSTTRKFGGAGLGLTIASKLSKVMSGHISVESEEGKGSRFTIALPLPVYP